MDMRHSETTTENTETYATDFFAWCLSTAALVRARQWDAIDPEALAEELEGLAKSDKRALEHRVEVLMMHLLKWQYQPEGRLESHSWYDTILEQRHQLALLLRDNPSLRPQMSAFLADAYPRACRRARAEMRPETPLPDPRVAIPLPPATSERRLALRPLATFPATCPWTVAQVLDTDFWPGSQPLGL